MISKAKVKHLRALQVKKYRKEHQCFVVEGAKSVGELLNSNFEVLWVAATEAFIHSKQHLLSKRGVEFAIATEAELIAAGSFHTNDGALAIARIRPNVAPTLKSAELALVLDDLRDPGNLGTIIRTADWYGVKQIIASEETADLYNPKVISSTMGSFCRVEVFYTNLVEFLSTYTGKVYGAFMDGADVHHVNFSSGGLVVIGNESNGISTAVAQVIAQRITIPRVGKAESLNAAIATGIILDVMYCNNPL
jgi:RNA methyltransferase, TrmH family